RLDPHGLPDAARGRVPDAVRIADLLAARLSRRIGGIPRGDHDLVRTGEQYGGGNIEGKGIVSAAMFAHVLAIDENASLEIDGAKMQEDPFAVPTPGHSEHPTIPEAVSLGDLLHNAGQGRFDWERDKYLGGESLRFSRILPGNDQVPKTIEI